MDTVCSLHSPAVVFWQVAISKSHCHRGLHESPLRAYSICKLNYFAVLQIEHNPLNAKNPDFGVAKTLEQRCNFKHISCLHKICELNAQPMLCIEC